jgi:hypothetical protein
MELLDRYLQAVKKFLPSRRQDDIIAELRANMESQLEDKEAELGRPLTATEAGDWLKQMGAPMMVAARYQPQQYLIGPAIFPIYLYVLRRVILWAFVIYAIVTAVLISFVSSNSTSVIDSVLRIPGILITVAAWVTAVFAAIEFFAVRYPEKCPQIAGLSGAWSPSTLPPLEKAPPTGRKPRSFAQAVAEIVFGLFFLGWLLLIPRQLFLIMGPGAFYWNASPFQFANAWMTFFWWAVALSVAQLVWRCVDLIRGTWQQSARVQRMTIQAIGLVPLGLLLSLPGRLYVTLKHPALDQLQYGSTLDTINKNIHSGVLFICAIVALQLAFDIGKIALDAYRKRATIQ